MTKFTDDDGEIIEITKDEAQTFRKAQDVHPEMLESMKRLRGQRGPQKDPLKEPVTLRLDHDILAYFKADGSGYQTRINEALREYISDQ